MGVLWTMHSLVPALLVALIAAVLSFAMVFISSMTDAIDRMIVILGSSNIVTSQSVDVSLWEGASIDHVVKAEGVVFSEKGKSLVQLKGIEEGYFSDERAEALKLTLSGETPRNPIVVSETLSRKLGLEMGSTMTLMLYEKEKNRARPVLATVTGIFDSGYAQLDRYLAYVDYSLIGGDGEWEILLSSRDNTEERAMELWEKGLWAETYQERYSSLYLNVRQSVTILYVILVAVALLAAFFSTDIVHIYISRDSRDIAGLRMMGMEEKDIRRIYTFLTLRSVAIAALVGIAAGTMLGMFSPSLVRAVASMDPGLVEYYISSFDAKVPWLELSGMFGAMIFLSAITVWTTLLRSGRKELSAILSDV